MAQKILKIFGKSDSQNKMKKKLEDFFRKFPYQNRNDAITAFKGIGDPKNNKEKVGNKLSTLSFIENISSDMEKAGKENSKEFKSQVKRSLAEQWRKLSYWAAIKTRENFKLIEKIIDKIADINAQINVTFEMANSERIEAKFSSDQEINKKSFEKALGLKNEDFVKKIIISDLSAKNPKQAENKFVLEYTSKELKISGNYTNFCQVFTDQTSYKLFKQYEISFVNFENKKEIILLYDTQNLADARKELNLEKNIYFMDFHCKKIPEDRPIISTKDQCIIEKSFVISLRDFFSIPIRLSNRKDFYIEFKTNETTDKELIKSKFKDRLELDNKKFICGFIISEENQFSSAQNNFIIECDFQKGIKTKNSAKNFVELFDDYSKTYYLYRQFNITFVYPDNNEKNLNLYESQYISEIEKALIGDRKNIGYRFKNSKSESLETNHEIREFEECCVKNGKFEIYLEEKKAPEKTEAVAQQKQAPINRGPSTSRSATRRSVPAVQKTNIEKLYKIEYKDEEITIKEKESLQVLKTQIKEKFKTEFWIITLDGKEMLNSFSSDKAVGSFLKNVNKKHILKTSETYTIGGQKIEVPVEKQVKDIFPIQGIKEKSYEILKGNQLILCIGDGKPENMTTGLKFCFQVFHEGIQYTIKKIEQQTEN